MDTDVVLNTSASSLAPANPQRSTDVANTYSFAGWTKNDQAIADWANEKITGNVQYKASYTATPIPYTVTFKNEDGTVLQAAAQYNYDTPAASITKPADPTKAATAQYTYTFAGWKANGQ